MASMEKSSDTDVPNLLLVAKRKVDLKWDDYFMAMACLASARKGSL